MGLYVPWSATVSPPAALPMARMIRRTQERRQTQTEHRTPTFLLRDAPAKPLGHVAEWGQWQDSSSHYTDSAPVCLNKQNWLDWKVDSSWGARKRWQNQTSLTALPFRRPVRANTDFSSVIGREVTSGALLRKKSTLTWMYLARCRGWQAQRGEDRTGERRGREGKTRKRQSFNGQAKMTKLIH